MEKEKRYCFCGELSVICEACCKKAIKAEKEQGKKRIDKLKSHLENWTYDTENQEEDFEWKVELIDSVYEEINKIWNKEG